MKYKFKEITVFLLLAFSFSWLAALVVISLKLSSGFVYYLLVGCGAVSPSVCAIITTYLFRGYPGIAELIKRTVKVRFSYTVYIWIFLIVILAYYSGTLIALYLGSAAPAVWIMAPRKISTSLASPIGEEIGWRGMLNPYLLQSFSPVYTSLITGIIWGTWHLWYYAVPGAFHFSTPFWLLLVDVCGGSLWYTFFYNRSSGSIFSAILFHFAGNLLYNIIPNAPASLNGDIKPYTITSIIIFISGIIINLFNRLQHVRNINQDIYSHS